MTLPDEVSLIQEIRFQKIIAHGKKFFKSIYPYGTMIKCRTYRNFY